MKKIRIALVDDHVMFRTTLKAYLEEFNNFSVVFDVGKGGELFSALNEITPDLIFMDFNLPGKDGIQLTEEIKEAFPDIKIIMLSNFDQEPFINQAISAGASAYLSKFEMPDEIHEAITEVMYKGHYLSNKVTESLLNNVQQKDGKVKKGSVVDLLTEVELRVIQLMSEEKTTKDISEILSKSVRTIDSYKNSIMKKTGAKNACGIVMFGVRVA